MSAILARLRNEPAVLAGVTTIAASLGVTVPAGAGWLGLGLAVLEAVLTAVVRSRVSPVAKPTVVSPVAPR